MSEHYTPNKLFIPHGLLDESPVLCEFKKGDVVTFTNEFGVVFEGMVVIGFGYPKEDWLKGAFIHIDRPGHECAWWFPHRADELKKN